MEDIIMITIASYEKNKSGSGYICHFFVGSSDMEMDEAIKEFEIVSKENFSVSPETLSVPINLGIPQRESTITILSKNGAETYYKNDAGYEKYFVNFDEIIVFPGIPGSEEVDTRWKRIITDDGIFPITESGKEYMAMSGAPVPSVVPSLTITRNGKYGWPQGKDFSEWTDDEWENGPIGSVVVNVPKEMSVGTVTGVLNEETNKYEIDFSELSTILDASDTLVFKLSDSIYTRPLMALFVGGSATYFEIADYLPGTPNEESRSVNTSIIYVKNRNMGSGEFVGLIKSKVPYNIYSYVT